MVTGKWFAGIREKLFRDKFLWISLCIFAVVYALISLVNHYCFRTYTLDLGLYTNALYDYSHFQWNDSTVFKEVPENLLADHFDLYLVIFSPLSWIFGTYTLLIVQIAAILFGGVGIYRYFGVQDASGRTSKAALIFFLLFFGIFSALSFDYHSNVVAAMLVPWFFYAFRQRNFRAALLWLLAILISKENMSLWTTFIALGLLCESFRNKEARSFLLLCFGISVGWFLLVTGWIMPALAASGKYAHFHYAVLGKNTGEAIRHLLEHPLDSLKVLFTNHNGSEHGDWVKVEFHLIFLVAGSWLLLRKPQYLLMLVPLYFQKLFHDDIAMWGIGHQYAIEFAPILTIGVFSAILSADKLRTRKILTVAVLLGGLISSVRVMDYTIAYTQKARIRIYNKVHYKREFDIAVVYKNLEMIPKNAVVSAQSALLPHLAWRDQIYQFPIVKDAEFLVYSPKDNPYPLDTIQFKKQIDSILQTGRWQTRVENSELVILHRKK
jgi:uncharacterized membrane protein